MKMESNQELPPYNLGKQDLFPQNQRLVKQRHETLPCTLNDLETMSLHIEP